MQVHGFDAPSEEDVSEFGLYHACQRSRGEFSLYEDDGLFAARGRVGLSPLYWNRESGIFSFIPGKNLEEFPPGYLYNLECDRLVCWEELYFDKPMKTLSCAVDDVKLLLMKATNRYQYDAFLMSSGCGSRMIELFLESYDIPRITVGTKYSHDVQNSDGHVIHCSSNDNSMEILAKNVANKTVICGIGCFELFSEDIDFRPTMIEEFAKYNVKVWSPFFDIDLVEYVLDKISPEDRKNIMYSFIDENMFDGMEIKYTTGIRKKKSWYTSINEIIQRWYV